MSWEERAKALGRFTWVNLDALLVIAVALGVLVVEVVGSPSRELVDSVILTLLGAMAFVMLRDRSHRVDLRDLRQMAADAISDRPYEVVWQINDWDLRDRDHATMRVTEQLRFTRNDVSTIADWSTGDGTVERYMAKWRRSEDDPWIPAEMIHKFPIRNGEKAIYSLDEEHCRGDMLDWCVVREAKGRFPTSHESVSLSARTSSDHPRVLRITWPTAAPPSHVEIRYKGEPARKLTTRQKDGRVYIEEKVAGLPVGEAVAIGWVW